MGPENEARREDVATTRSPLGRRRSEKASLHSQENSQDGPMGRHLEGSRTENPAAEESEVPADHVDMRSSDHHSYSSEPVPVSQFCFVSDVCSCDLHRLDRALLPGAGHLANDPHFLKTWFLQGTTYVTI